MKAAFFSPNTGFTVTNTESPHARTNEAVIRVEACGICGSDRQLVSGETPPAGTEFPVVLGHEIAGRIESTGDDTDTPSRWEQGQNVLVYPFFPCGECQVCRAGLSHLCARQQVIGYHLPGGFAEETAVPVENLLARPKSVSASAGALLVDAFATPYHALKHVSLAADETVLVLGAGGIGLSALMLAKALGAHGVGLVSRRLTAFDNLPAAAADKHFSAAEGERQLGRQVRRWSKGGVDVVIDTTGSAKLIELGLNLLHPGGRLAMVGMKNEDLTLPIAKTVRRGISITASYGSSKQDVKELLALVDENKLRPENLVAAKIPLEQITKAFDTQGPAGRTVIVP